MRVDDQLEADESDLTVVTPDCRKEGKTKESRDAFSPKKKRKQLNY